MSAQSFSDWLHHNAGGRNLAARERDFFAAALRDVRGQVVLQLELNGFDTLSAAPVSRKVHVGNNPHSNVCCDIRQLPFPHDSADAVCLPHTLEWHPPPQQILREAHRVLRPEGRLIISALNPYSPWFFSRLWNNDTLPLRRHCLRIARLKDWLDLLGFDIIGGQFMVYTPLINNAERLTRLNFCNLAGNRWLPQYAAAYGLIAVKRVIALRPLKPQWRQAPAAVPGWAVSAQIVPKNEGG